MIERIVPPAAIEARLVRDCDQHHITVVTPREWQRYRPDHEDRETHGGLAGAAVTARNRTLKHLVLRQALEAGLGSCCHDIVVRGLGTAREAQAQCWFLVVDWPSAARWRRQHGLAKHDFHITVGFQHSDIHGVAKNCSTLIKGVTETTDLEPEPEPEGLRIPAASPSEEQQHAVGVVLQRLVTPARLVAHIDWRREHRHWDPDPRNAKEMRDFLRSFRHAVLDDMRSTQLTEVEVLCAAVGSPAALALTTATKNVVAAWARDSSSSSSEPPGYDAGVALVRTISRRRLDAAREAERAARAEEAAIGAELAAVQLELERYHRAGAAAAAAGCGDGVPVERTLVCIRHGPRTVIEVAYYSGGSAAVVVLSFPN
jgi:hypothetical protein